MADVVGLILDIADICSTAASKLEEVREIAKDCRELAGLLQRMGLLLNDVATEYDGSRKLKKASAENSVKALEVSVQECMNLVEDLSKKSKFWLFFRSSDHVSSLKGVMTRLALDLSTFQTALGLEQHANLNRAAIQLQEDLRDVPLEVMRGFEAQAAELRRQFEEMREEVRAHPSGGDAGGMEGRVRTAVLAALKDAGLVKGPGDFNKEEAEEVLAALRSEMEGLRLEKRAMEMQYLKHVVTALTLSAAAPANFRCPITLCLMRDPVVLIEGGHSFERAAIKQHLATCNTNPMTNLPLSSKRLIPNIALRGAIEAWLRERGLTHEEVDQMAVEDSVGGGGGGGETNKMGQHKQQDDGGDDDDDEVVVRPRVLQQQVPLTEDTEKPGVVSKVVVAFRKMFRPLPAAEVCSKRGPKAGAPKGKDAVARGRTRDGVSDTNSNSDLKNKNSGKDGRGNGNCRDTSYGTGSDVCSNSNSYNGRGGDTDLQWNTEENPKSYGRVDKDGTKEHAEQQVSSRPGAKAKATLAQRTQLRRTVKGSKPKSSEQGVSFFRSSVCSDYEGRIEQDNSDSSDNCEDY